MMKLGKIALDYIESICKKVRPSSARQSFRQELTDHLEEKVNELMENGFSQDCAEWEAIARMGNADVISKGINRVHFPLALTIAKYICLAITCYLGFVNLFPIFALWGVLGGASEPISVNTFSNSDGSIGVIGGADGPTAVFVSYPADSFLLFVLFLLFACITIFLFVLPYINKKKY